MEQSPTIGKLAAALSKAQGEISAAIKDSKNPHFGSSYADLASVMAVAREPLAKHELAVMQTADDSDGDAEHLTLVTTLAHSSGEWIRGRLRMPAGGPGNKLNPQTFGSCMTYARRYSLAAIVGIVQDDDDGNGASQRPPARPSRPRERTNAPPPEPTPAQGDIVPPTGTEYEQVLAKIKRLQDMTNVTDMQIKAWRGQKFPDQKGKPSLAMLKIIHTALNEGEIMGVK